jgi:hypothetical protein
MHTGLRRLPVAFASLAIVACGADGTSRRPAAPTPQGNASRRAPPVSTGHSDTRWSGRAEDSWTSIDSMKTFLDLTTIPVGIRTVMPRVLACGTQSTAKGKVQVHLKVMPDGHVAKASVKTAPDAVLGACVASAMAGALFPKTDLGGTFTYPFTF